MIITTKFAKNDTAYCLVNNLIVKVTVVQVTAVSDTNLKISNFVQDKNGVQFTVDESLLFASVSDLATGISAIYTTANP